MAKNKKRFRPKNQQFRPETTPERATATPAPVNPPSSSSSASTSRPTTPPTPTPDQAVTAFMTKVKAMEQDHQLDLSSDEDLSLAVMNLIAIEEHLFFTAQKTQDTGYYDVLHEVRDMRQSLMRLLIQDYEGEVWCASKHLLSASMRCMEVGTKFLTKSDRAQAEDFFSRSYDLYNLFWGLNLKLIKKQELSQLPVEEKAEIDQMSAQAGETFSATLASELAGEEQITEPVTSTPQPATTAIPSVTTSSAAASTPSFTTAFSLADLDPAMEPEEDEAAQATDPAITPVDPNQLDLGLLGADLPTVDSTADPEADLVTVDNTFLESLTITDEEEADALLAATNRATTDSSHPTASTPVQIPATAPSRLHSASIHPAPIITATKRPSLFAKLGQVVGKALNCCRE